MKIWLICDHVLDMLSIHSLLSCKLEFKLKYQSIRYLNIDLEKGPKLTKESTFGSISEELKYGLID